MSSSRVVVTGLGAVSCFGAGVHEFWRGLTSGASGQTAIRRFDEAGYRSSLAAEVPWAGLPSISVDGGSAPLVEDASWIASVAADEAMSDAGLLGTDSRTTGCVVGTLFSSIHLFERYGRLFFRSSPVGEVEYPDVDTSSVAYQLECLVGRFRLGGPATLISTACSSSTDAIGCAADFIRNGEADAMLAGGADILWEMAHAGFNSFFSITRECVRSFDTSRSGFFIGEGAGMLMLESLEHALARGARIYAEVRGYGLSNTAFHLTATSEDGSGEALAIRRCLEDAGIAHSRIDYVNAHGTATPHNDVSEIKALKTAFGTDVAGIAVSSVKANIGHCMGAAGALEAIATIKCVEQGFIPPTLNSTGDLDTELDFALDSGKVRNVDFAISQSFGFGGACSAVLFGSPRQIEPSAQGLGATECLPPDEARKRHAHG
jgi:3-oxoacyl-[acyl-carrier-protein] synthase II